MSFACHLFVQHTIARMRTIGFIANSTVEGCTGEKSGRETSSVGFPLPLIFTMGRPTRFGSLSLRHCHASVGSDPESAADWFYADGDQTTFLWISRRDSTVSPLPEVEKAKHC